jgi:hypothetical protein
MLAFKSSNANSASRYAYSNDYGTTFTTLDALITTVVCNKFIMSGDCNHIYCLPQTANVNILCYEFSNKQTYAISTTTAIVGKLVKGAGSFLIDHPDPIKKTQGYKLKHCFVESPTRGDNIYRFTTTTVDKTASITLPDYFKHLNENPQVWITPVDFLGYGYGTVTEDLSTVKITVNEDGKYNVLVIGTRKDQIAKDFFDRDGVEYIGN